jgi:uncharacterized protein (TIGR02270 family)
MTVVQSVVDQHAEEATFLWALRSIAVGSPHYDLRRDLSRLDDRLESHLDGLRVARHDGWMTIRPSLDVGEAGAAFAAGVLALEGGDSARIAEVFAAVEKHPDAAPGLASAMGWLRYDLVGNHLWKLQKATVEAHRYVGIAGAALNRQDPGPFLKEALKAKEPRLLGRAFQAAGELGRTDLAGFFWTGFSHADRGVRFQAGQAAALLGDLNSIDVLKKLAVSAGPHRDEAVAMALRRMEDKERQGWQGDLLGNSDCIRQAAVGLGAVGDPALVPLLIEKMTVDKVARVAGEAFTLITGADLAYLDLERNRPEDFESGPTENPEDEDVSMDEDENLPWPDRARVEKWWAAHRSEFRPGRRHILGKLMTPEHLQWVLRHGRQRQRAAAALELALLDPKAPLFEVRAPAPRQKQLLGL